MVTDFYQELFSTDLKLEECYHLINKVLAPDCKIKSAYFDEGALDVHGFKQHVADEKHAFPDLNCAVYDCAATTGGTAGEWVVYLRWVKLGRFTGQKGFKGLPPNHAKLELRGVSIFNVKAGHIINGQEYVDQLQLLDQLGKSLYAYLPGSGSRQTGSGGLLQSAVETVATSIGGAVEKAKEVFGGK